MRNLVLPIAASFAVLFLACQSNDHPHGAEPADPANGEEHGHGDSSESITHWTDQTELFVEFPSLIVGQESAFAAHLTRLSDFGPVDVGRVTVVLSGGEAPEERFAVSKPTVPGIFRPVARPQHGGLRELSLLLESDALTDTHALGELTVFLDADAAAHAASPNEAVAGAGISFLKEQQWPIDFATAEVAERALRPSLSVSGTVRARADGEVHVTAPRSGRLVTAGDAFPRIGQEVERDQILVTLAPRLGVEADIASLELAAARARLDVEHTRRERERLEGLLAEGAVAERRVLAARRDEAQAQAELTAAQRRLRQHGRIQRASASGSVGEITVRAPLSGTLVAVDVAPGMFLEQGREMFHVVDLDRLWLEVRIPEANIGRVEQPTGVWFEVAGFDEPFEVAGDRVVTTGGIVDARTRTIPLIFGIDNPERRLRVGMFARVRVLTGAPVTAVTIPTAAVLDDGGQEVAYIQSEGETFERRVVRLGIRDGGHVEVIQGVRSGEHVVIRGAFMVKLAASATEAPAHGHAH